MPPYPTKQHKPYQKSQHNHTSVNKVREGERESTYGHVKATMLELSILLTQSTFLAKAMDAAIRAGALFQEILSSQFGSVEA